MKGIALFPGAFKPPTAGHFTAVEELATNTYSDIDDSTDKTVTKVVILIGGKPRDGIDAATAEKIWKIYLKYLPNNVELINTQESPVRVALNIIKENPKQNYFPVVGMRDESDKKDLGRLSSFEKLENSHSIVLKGTTTIRASELRRKISTSDFDKIMPFLPDQLPVAEREEVYKILKSNINYIVEEKLYQDLGTFFDSFVDEGSSGTAIAARSALSSSDRSKLVHLYNHLKNVIYEPTYDLDFQQDRIVIKLKDQAKISYDYTPYMASILEYMIDEGIGITPLPEIKIKKDIKESSSIFGKTAYYNPDEKEITLFVLGRHPKDVLRSFTHEMIHHKQNLEGRISDITTTNTNEDSSLSELEEEAYLVGNMTFRNWEDKIKNSL